MKPVLLPEEEATIRNHRPFSFWGRSQYSNPAIPEWPLIERIRDAAFEFQNNFCGRPDVSDCDRQCRCPGGC